MTAQSQDTSADEGLENVVLVVDDDPQIRKLLSRYLSRHEFTVHEAGSGQEMREQIERVSPSIVLLDVGLPDIDGLSLLRDLKSSTHLGVIMISGMADTIDRVVGLELGADDYVTKPVDHRELLARIRSVRRRVQQVREASAGAVSAIAPGAGDDDSLRFCDWRLDARARSLTSPTGEEVELTTMEFDTLLALASRPGRVMDREQLLQAVANRNWDPFDRAVDAVIVKLRRKLGEDPKHPQMIKTVRGVGYVFAAKVDQ